MASRMHSRPIRPTPSRKSDFLQEIPTVIYSQGAAEFRPPADYVGPRKSLMRRPPDPSMNPRKVSLPLLSVSKLNVQVAVPPSSQISLPRVGGPAGKVSNRALECAQAQSIFRKMPSSFRRQFRTELLKKRPIKGSVRRFVHRDIHDLGPTEPPVLHGIILLGGNHRDMVEELPQEPGTPPPLSGRRHCNIQTETYLEDIADNESGFITTEMQCEPIHDEPLEATPLNFEEEQELENLATTGTQLDQWVFADTDINHVFDQLATNVADAVIMESLKQLQEEFELEALRKQHEYHKCLRNREMAILAKYKAAQEKYEEQKRILESRKPWDQTLDQIIQLVGFDKIRDVAPLHFIGSQTDQAVYEHIQDTIPPLNEETVREVGKKKLGRNVLDHIITDTVVKREAEYAGKMYIGDPKKKGSLATESSGRQSVGDYEDWLGELDEDEYELRDYEIPDYSLTEPAVQSRQREQGSQDDEPKWKGEAWDDVEGGNRRSSESDDDNMF